MATPLLRRAPGWSLALLLVACVAPPPPPPPAIVVVPGRPAAPLVMRTADAMPPPGPAEAPGMRAVVADVHGAWFLDSRRHAVLFAPLGRAAELRGDWRGEFGLAALAGDTLLVADHGRLLAFGAGSEPRTLAADLAPVQALTADASTAYVATSTFYGSGPDGPDGRILAISVGEGQMRTVAEKLPGPVALACLGPYLYFTAQGQVGRVAKAGGVPTEVADLSNDYGWRLAVSADYIYFTVQSTAGVSLQRVPTAGGIREEIARLQIQPTSLALHGQGLWMIAEADAPGVGTLWRLDLVTRTLETVATSLTGYTFVVAGPTYIAWTSGEEGFVLTSGASVPRRIEGVLGPRP